MTPPTDNTPRKKRSRLRRAGCAIVLALNLLVCAGLLLSSWCGSVPPSRWHPAVLVSMTFPAWLAAAALCFVADLLLWRRTALVPGISMLLCMGTIQNFCPLHFPKGEMPAAEAGRSFTVMTYNVYLMLAQDDSLRSNPQIDYILERKPDIVCLQEALLLHMIPQNKLQQWQLDSLSAIYPYVIVNSEDVALLSKYPAEPIDMGYPSHNTHNGVICGYRVDVDGMDLMVFNAHLRSLHFNQHDKAIYREAINIDSVSRSSLSAFRYELVPKLVTAALDREEQAQRLAAYIDSCDIANVLVCGDFNDTENSYPARYLRSRCGLRDVYASCAFGPTITYNANHFFFRIDHMLWRGAFKARSVERGTLKASDHYPLEAVFVKD